MFSQNNPQSVVSVLASNPKILRTKDVTNSYDPEERRRKSPEEVDRTVMYLLEKFQSEDHIPLFRHIAWQLPIGTVERIAGEAKERSKWSPIGYFIKLAKQEGYKPPKKEEVI